MSVTAITGVITFKKLFGCRSDDWIDKLNHAYTVLILVIFATVISTGQFVGDPIHCWVPAEFTGAYESYTKSYCWIKNTYYVALHDVIPSDVSVRQDAEISYYQWTPLILMFMAFMFKTPNILWRTLNGHTGLNFNKIFTMADTYVCATKTERDNCVTSLTFFMDKWLRSHQYRNHNFLTRAKAKISKVAFFVCSKREGKYISAVYLTIKMSYVINVISQFYVLNAFLGMDFNSYGYRVLDGLATGHNWEGSPRFPRVTMCDFQIRQLQNILNYTVQCVLPINLFNEKLFIFIWFWLFMLAILSTVNFAKWLFLLVFKNNNYKFVKKYLKISQEMKKEPEKRQIRKFANYYLRDDGCFVLRMIAENSSEMVVVELLNEMWKNYKDGSKKSSVVGEELEHSDIPYIDSENVAQTT